MTVLPLGKQVASDAGVKINIFPCLLAARQASAAWVHVKGGKQIIDIAVSQTLNESRNIFDVCDFINIDNSKFR